MLTLEVMLASKPGQPADALDGPLAAETAKIVAALPDGTRTRVVHALKHHRDDALRAGNSLDRFDVFLETGLVPSHTKVPIASFDVVLEVSVPDGTESDLVLRAVDGLADRLPVVDPARSAAVFGVDHPIMEGNAPVQLFVCLFRVPTQTHDQFADWWLHQLVEHTTKTPGKSAYRQLHGDPQLTARAAKAVGVEIDDVDGVALEFYPDLDRIYAASDWADAPYAPIVNAENQMIDFTRALAILAYNADNMSPVQHVADGH